MSIMVDRLKSCQHISKPLVVCSIAHAMLILIRYRLKQLLKY